MESHRTIVEGLLRLDPSDRNARRLCYAYDTAIIVAGKDKNKHVASYRKKKVSLTERLQAPN